MGNRRLELTGQVFGRLVASRRVKKMGSSFGWLCVCECGNTTTVRGSALKAGLVISCGCAMKKHGHTVGGNPSRTYRAWGHMLQRCYNPKYTQYHDYGGRGIRVCARWKNSFENFLADMGDKPKGLSLDRQNVQKGYTPANCKWSDAREQRKNKRRIAAIENFSTRQLLAELRRRKQKYS